MKNTIKIHYETLQFLAKFSASVRVFKDKDTPETKDDDDVFAR